MKKKILSLMLCLTTVLGMGTMAYATELDENGVYETAQGISVGKSDITLEVVEFDPILIATVPIELPIIVDTKGQVTVPSNDVAKIINNSDKALKVTAINIATNEDWGVSQYRGNGVSRKNKGIGIELRGDNVETELVMSTYYAKNNFRLTANNWTIDANVELPLEMQAVVSSAGYATLSEPTSIGTLSFTLAFAE